MNKTRMDRIFNFSKETNSIKFEYGHILKIKQFKGHNDLVFILRPELHLKVDDKIKPISYSLSNLFKDSYSANIIDCRGGNLDFYINDGLEISIIDFNINQQEFSIDMIYEITEI